MAADRGETPIDIEEHHPAFDGHFPGEPIVPGVVLLAEALAILESREAWSPERWTLASAKFLSPAQPGEALVMTRERLASGSVRWEIRAADRVVANGLVSPRACGPAGP